MRKASGSAVPLGLVASAVGMGAECETSTSANETGHTGLDEHLGGRGVAEEVDGTRGEAVGPGLEESNQVADVRSRKRHVPGQRIERSAQRAHDIDGLGRWLI